MKRYDTYKGSGVQWIGEIPSHWNAIKTSLVFNNIGSGTTPTSSNPNYYTEEGDGYNWLQTGDLNDGEITSTSKQVTKVAVNECNLKFYPENSVVIAMYGATIGKVGLLQISTATNQACCVLPQSNLIVPKFAFFLYKTAKMPLLIEAMGGGQPNISQDIIKKLYVPIPPLVEQEAIAAWLDVKCGEIDKVIATQQRRIELLHQLRQSIITRAVTRGINPDAPLRPSGIDWIGDVPAHWKLIKTSLVFNKIGSGTTPTSSNPDFYTENEDGYYWLQTGDLNDGEITSTSKQVTDLAVRTNNLKFYPINSIVIAMYGATIGKIGILKIETATNQACCVLSESKIMTPQFSFYTYQSAKPTMLVEAMGGGQPNISQDIIRKLKVPIPPLAEQREIVAYVERETGKVDVAIASAEREIALLQELRQSVITEVVTGKRKVC